MLPGMGQQSQFRKFISVYKCSESLSANSSTRPSYQNRLINLEYLMALVQLMSYEALIQGLYGPRVPFIYRRDYESRVNKSEKHPIIQQNMTEQWPKASYKQVSLTAHMSDLSR
jgi:hypothetical protein